MTTHQHHSSNPERSKTTAKGYAVVTGASGGIGLHLAEELSSQGYPLLLIARSTDRLAAICQKITAEHGVDAQYLTLDLASADNVQKVLRSIDDRGLPIQILVNNAGYGVYAPLVENDPVELSGMMALNVVSLTLLTKAFAERFLKQNQGYILNVASTAAFQPGPGMAAYYASKSYVLSLTEALAHEMKGTGVSVTALCQGPTASGFQERAQMHGSRMLTLNPVADAKTVAIKGVKAMFRRKAVYVPGFMNRILALSVRILTRSTATRIAAFVTAPQGS